MWGKLWHSADFAYPLTGSTAADSYLNQDQIFAIAQAAGVDAIHPGYGFLSENADFAAHQIKFIGPSPQAMSTAEVDGVKMKD